MAAGVSTQGLTKHYGAVAAVREVSFDVAAGEIFGLLGPNGAGKSTTLDCLLGLRRPDRGTITIGGVDALAHPAQVRRTLGAVLQSTALQDNITPRQALRLFASFHGRTSVDADRLLERFALTDKADGTFRNLSGGQRQRLALALAFIHEPGVLVLDEPTAGLDPLARRELHTLITETRASGCTVLLSTHHLEEAHLLCDRLAIIDRGRIVATDTPAGLIARAGGHSRVCVRTARAPTTTQLETLNQLGPATIVDGVLTLNTREVSRAVMELTQWIVHSGNELLDLQIHPPTLEDAFLAITGRTWSTAEETDA